MTHRIAMMLVAAVLANGSAATGDTAVQRTDRLPSITDSSTYPELRMWRTVAHLEGVDGVVVTPGIVRFYSGDELGTAKQVGFLRTAKADEILSAIEDMEEHDGKSLSCSRFKDGWSLEVEGVSSGGHFAFTAHVPNVCAEGPPREVFDVYVQLSALREQRPN